MQRVKKQMGFGAVEGVLLVIIIGLIGFGGWYVLDRQDTDKTTNTAQSTQEDSDEYQATESVEEAPETANYKVTFSVAWSSDTHSDTLPSGAHTSPAVVATHSSQGSLYAPGGQASPGIQQVAETGATSLVEPELTENSDIHAYAKGARLDAPGVDTVEIEATQDADLLSIISMLAPSPDWFVGLDSIDLFNGDGSNTWMESSAHTVIAYDAGTDSGATFTASNSATNPHDTITPPVDSEFIDAAKTPFGTVTIERIN